MRIAVIGAGYVGLVSAACFAEIGHDVIAVDNDPAKIETLRAGHIPIHEEHLPELVARHRNGRLRFSSDIHSSCKDVHAVFICVGTPPSCTGEADLSHVETVARELARSRDSYKVIIEKSTVPVGTCEAISRTMLLYGAASADFSIASNPEFLREGTAVMDFLHPDRVLMGVSDKVSETVLLEIYQPILDGSYYNQSDAFAPQSKLIAASPIITTVKSAEMINTPRMHFSH